MTQFTSPTHYTTVTTTRHIETLIKARARELDLDACGIAQSGPVSEAAAARYRQWIASGGNGCMDYAARYLDVRDNPALLLDGARSIIVVAMNYYPARLQREDAPQFAYYAYGRDYHEVMRDRLQRLAAYIKQLVPDAETRCCVDTAPLRERYWAVQAGVGFVGRNNALIIPGKGSFFFLGAIVTTAELAPDSPCTLTCGDCGACERACPGGALKQGRPVDATRCLSCLTIEYRGELPQWTREALGNRVYGCDECQRVCPHNRNAVPTTVPELQPSEAFLNLSAADIAQMDQAAFSRLFSHSAVKRTKLAGLQRNLRHILPETFNPESALGHG